MILARSFKAILLNLLAFAALSCRSDEGSNPPGSDTRISTDQQLFTLVTRTDPFTAYSLFPRADSVTQGTLNGSNAHQPLVRVSMNATAYNALRGDTLAAGSTFPDGSIIFKQIKSNGQTILYAVIYKDRNNPVAGNGWLWAEYSPAGNVVVSITTRGGGCTGCHATEQGPRHDFVRTFERQH